MAQITKAGRALYKGLGMEENPIMDFGGYFDTRLAVCSLIARHATTLHRMYEIDCSIEMSERQQATHEKREAQLEARIAALVAQLGEGFELNLNGDPRGFPVKIKNPAGRYNTWGGAEDGWGV